MHIVEKPSNPDAGPRFRRRSFELQSLKDVLLAVVLGGVWLAVILNLDHVRGSWPVRGALIALLTFGILVAIDSLLQSATQRITPTGVGSFGVTGWRWLR